jgi:hypothetical protein
LAYIYLDEGEKADESMLALLHENPEYQPNEALDPSEYIQLYKTFRTWPIYRLGGKLGGNMTLPNLVSLGGVNNLNKDAGGTLPKYSPGFGFTFALSFEIPLNKKLVLNPEVNFSSRKILFENEGLIRDTDGNVISYNEIEESHNWLELPILLQYNLMENRWNPYVGLGGSVSYLMSGSFSNITRFVNDGQDIRPKPLSSDAYNPINLSAMASVGVKRKVKGGLFIMEARLQYGFTQIRDTEALLSNEYEYVYDYMGMTDEFKMINISMTAGYLFNIYNPKKLK